MVFFKEENNKVLSEILGIFILWFCVVRRKDYLKKCGID